MGRKIILIVSILLIVVSLSGLTCVALGVDVLDLLSFEKTTTCTKEYNDEEGNQVKDTMYITYNKNVLKIENTNITSYKDNSMVDFTLSFGQLFSQAFNQIDGLNANYKKIDNNTIKYVLKVDFQNLNEVKLRELFDNFESDGKAFYSEKNITFEEFKKQSLNDYVCE